MTPPFQTVYSADWSNAAYVFFGSASACSGHGHVDANTSTCVCDAQWSGHSDFVDAQYVQCQLQTSVLTALWIANVVLFILVFLYSAPRLWVLAKRFRAAKQVAEARGQRLSIWDNKGFVTLLLFFALCFPSQLIVGFLRIFDFNRKIGIDVLITIFWALERLGFYSAVAVHQPSLMRHMLQAQDATARIVRNADLVGRGIAALASMAAFFALPVLVTQGRNLALARGCFATYCMTQTITFGLLHMQARYVQRNVTVLLTAAYAQTKNQAVLILRDKLSVGQDSIVLQSRVQVLIYFVYLVVPPLWITHDYLLVISWFGPILMSKRVVDSIYMEDSEHQIVSGANRSTSDVNDQVPARGKNLHSTLHSADVETVMVVNEDSPELMAKGRDWSMRLKAKTGPLFSPRKGNNA